MAELLELKIDEKWSIWFDPNNNDRPVHWTRYNQEPRPWVNNNAVTALFYALLKERNSHAHP